MTTKDELHGTGVVPADDYFHERDDNPYWNESGWFGFQIPERTLTGFVYMYHRPNMNYSVGGVAFWDPSGEETYDCLYYDWGDTYAMAEGTNMFDFSLPNGLTVECVEPIKTINMSYHKGDWYGGRGCELDLQYNAFIYPHHTGYPTGQQEWGPAKGHYEQPGRIKGTVVLNGETIEIDTWCERDRSWGARSLHNDARGNFPWAIASETSAFQVFAMTDLPPDEDPIDGTTERIAAGWYLKDGKYGSLRSGDWRVLDRAPNGQPLRMQAVATDSLGREFYAEGRATNNLNWHGYPYLWEWWGQVEWQFDGQTCYGEHMDYLPLQLGRKYLRSRGR